MVRQFSCRSALVLSVIAFGGAAQAGMMLDGVPSSQYEAYALNPLYHASGWLTAADSSGTLVSWGSAVLIDPHWILMSGHQLYGKTYSTVQFGLGSNILTSPGETRSVATTYWYPDYAGGVGGSTSDIALGYLVDPIFDVLPAARFTGAVDVGTHVSIIGYGARVPRLACPTVLSALRDKPAVAPARRHGDAEKGARARRRSHALGAGLPTSPGSGPQVSVVCGDLRSP
jgi:hypothetical protein